MRAHEIDATGVIINTIMVPSLEWAPNLVDASIGGTIGDSIVDGKLILSQPEVIAVPVPGVVTIRQARRALLEAGLLDAVESAIVSIPDDMQRKRTQVEWESARDVERNNPYTQSLAVLIGIGDEELDELFRIAATL